MIGWWKRRKELIRFYFEDVPELMKAYEAAYHELDRTLSELEWQIPVTTTNKIAMEARQRAESNLLPALKKFSSNYIK